MNRTLGWLVLVGALAVPTAFAQTATPLLPPLFPPAPAPAQTDATVRALIPDLISLRRPEGDQSVTFDLNATNYPPQAFPAQYVSAPRLFSVFSSTASSWTVQMELRAQPGSNGRVIPDRQLSYRINGGPWIAMNGAPQVVLSSVGPTPGWLPVQVEFALNLTGAEYGGDYAFDVAFTAVVLP